MKSNQIVFEIALLIIYLGCFGCKTSKVHSVTNVKVSFNLPVIQKTNNEINFSNFKDTTSIFYYKEHNFYFLPYRKLALVDDSVTKEEISYNVFILKQNESMGYYFLNERDTTPVGKFKADSILDRRNLLNNIDITNEAKLVSSSYANKNGRLIEKYITDNTLSEESVDTIIYHFDKRLNSVDYSLSSSVDSLKKMKLQKVVFLYLEKYSAKLDTILPRRELVYSIDAVKIQDISRTKVKLDSLLDAIKKHTVFVEKKP